MQRRNPQWERVREMSTKCGTLRRGVGRQAVPKAKVPPATTRLGVRVGASSLRKPLAVTAIDCL